MSQTLISDRRASRLADDLSPVQLVEAHREEARAQLATARTHLIAARRRVQELEVAVSNWDEFTRLAMLTRSRSC